MISSLTLCFKSMKFIRLDVERKTMICKVFIWVSQKFWKMILTLAHDNITMMCIYIIVLCILDVEDTMEHFSCLSLFNFEILLPLQVIVRFDILRRFGGFSDRTKSFESLIFEYAAVIELVLDAFFFISFCWQ